MVEPKENHAQVMIPPPLVFLGYLVGALIVNWIIPFPALWEFPLRIIGGSMVIAGFLLAGSAVTQMIKANTSPDPHRPTIALITRVSYRFTRNPIYLGFFLIYLGFTFWAGTLWGVLLSPFLIWTVIRAGIRAEEIYLDGKFGEQYTSYKSRVRRWL